MTKAPNAVTAPPSKEEQKDEVEKRFAALELEEAPTEMRNGT